MKCSNFNFKPSPVSTLNMDKALAAKTLKIEIRAIVGNNLPLLALLVSKKKSPLENETCVKIQIV